MRINTEPERLTRAVFAAVDDFNARRLVACDLGHAASYWADVQCLDCQRFWQNDELLAHACPVCDGRVKDLA